MIFKSDQRPNGQPGENRGVASTMQRPESLSTARLVGSDVHIVGDVTSDQEVQVDGTIEGSVKCPTVLVGEPGMVKGDVAGDTVVVRGTVDGRIQSRALSLASTSRVEGKVEVEESLAIDAGADFWGTIERHPAGSRKGKAAAAARRANGDVQELGGSEKAAPTASKAASDKSKGEAEKAGGG